MHPWLKYVRDILNSCGLSYDWINQSFSSINWLKSIVKETLVNQLLHDWFRNVENSPPNDWITESLRKDLVRKLNLRNFQAI